MRCLTTWSSPLLNIYLIIYKKDLKVLLAPSGECLSGSQRASLREEVFLHQEVIELIEAILASRA